ncbi:centromere protein Chl4/mis15/CENP-N [Xylariaceae sp. FL0804]|nr:centromere protein Chl4/mis15/CENP-N [Xylariaceae sp. FL0804]
MARLSLPTAARLPSSLRVDPTNASVQKVLNRLSRASLLNLVLDWLDARNQALCPPLLRRPRRRDPDSSNPDSSPLSEDEDEDGDDDQWADDLYPPARSAADLAKLYTAMQTRKGGKREVVDRVLEGDWRRGLSLYQLAMADLQYLYDHPGTLKWSCFRIARLQTPAHEDDVDDASDGGGRGAVKLDRESLHVPRFHPSTFLRNLQAEVLPDVKAHYNFDRPRGQPLLLLRIFVLDSPYNTDLAVSSTATTTAGSGPDSATTTSFDASRTIYVAFPDASPHIFVSKQSSSSSSPAAAAAMTATATTKPTAAEARSLRALVVEGIPKALSRPRCRYALRPTALQTRNLGAMLAARGAGRGNAAQAGWGVYAADGPRDAARDSPLAVALPTPPRDDDDDDDDDNDNGGEGGKENRDPDGAARSSTKTVGSEGTVAPTSHVGGGGRKRPHEAATGLRQQGEEEERRRKARRRAAAARFGDSARVGDGRGVERMEVVLDDEAFPRGSLPSPGGEDGEDAGDAADEEEEAWRPQVRLVLHGAHVFAGVRRLVEAGVVDGARAPGWLTGEDGVTTAAVRHGRVRGGRGSGLLAD